MSFNTSALFLAKNKFIKLKEEILKKPFFKEEIAKHFFNFQCYNKKKVIY